jgi:hypothetical protein
MKVFFFFYIMASFFFNRTDFQVIFLPIEVVNFSKFLRYSESSIFSKYFFLFSVSKNQKVNFYLLILIDPLFGEFQNKLNIPHIAKNRNIICSKKSKSFFLDFTVSFVIA